jgi:hypothetical protein
MQRIRYRMLLSSECACVDFLIIPESCRLKDV